MVMIIIIGEPLEASLFHLISSSSKCEQIDAHNNPMSRSYYYYPHFTERGIEAERSLRNLPKVKQNLIGLRRAGESNPTKIV